MTDATPRAGAARALWVITGPTGGGRDVVVDAIRRAGILCVDGLPVALVAPLAAAAGAEPVVAMVDAREGDSISQLRSTPNVLIAYLDADDATLARRLADSTALHPCAGDGTGRGAVAAERSLLEPARGAADVVIDTTGMAADAVGRRLVELVVGEDVAQTGQALKWTVSSFGFKHGPQVEADWTVDVRFLPNPFWVPDLRPLTGLDPRVASHVLDGDAGRSLLERLEGLFCWVGDQAQAHGRRHLHVAVGCTGGRHRSVATAAALAARMRARGWSVRVPHRDVERPDPR